MYYDTLQQAIDAEPECTHVLTTGPRWGGPTETKGKFEPVILGDDGRYRGGDGLATKISARFWIVAWTRSQKMSRTEAAYYIPAPEFLERGAKHMRDRAEQRDTAGGERSMARAVAAFNAQEGTNLTEEQGWRFMVQLKYARSVYGVFVADDYEDMAAYAGLAGEAASRKEAK